MRRTWIGAAVAATGVGVVAGRRVMQRRQGGGQNDASRDRWHSVTIFCEPEQLGALPPPLDELGAPVEVRIRPAPGGRGTELAARLTPPTPTGLGKVVAKLRDDDPVRLLRRSLREARQLAEIGEVLLPDAPSTTHPTLTGAPLAYATRHGREDGRL